MKFVTGIVFMVNHKMKKSNQKKYVYSRTNSLENKFQKIQERIQHNFSHQNKPNQLNFHPQLTLHLLLIL
jgi:hypothetical protein